VPQELLSYGHNAWCALTSADWELKNCAIHGERGTYFNRLGNLSKAWHSYLGQVDSVGPARGVQVCPGSSVLKGDTR
jgi:hypothetical protein